VRDRDFLALHARNVDLTRSSGMRALRHFIAILAFLVPGVAILGPSSASAVSWAPAATATIHPGVQLFTSGGQCTANFIYTDGSTVYIGQAAHCSGTGGNTATNGCTSGSLPLGTQVEITGAAHPGTMVYNSWLTMQSLGEADADTCQYNDLALVRVDPADVATVNPSVPHWGGPTGLNASGLSFGQQIFSYGNSELRFGITQLSPKTGISNGDQGGGWSHGTTLVTTGIPGDSGSALLDTSGRAAGVLSTPCQRDRSVQRVTAAGRLSGDRAVSPSARATRPGRPSRPSPTAHGRRP
jgi:hypothetical protein